MAMMNISVPDEMKTFVEAQAHQEGYASVSEYVRAVIHDVQKRKARQELEAKLLAGLEGPATEMTSEDWASIEHEALDGLAGEANRP